MSSSDNMQDKGPTGCCYHPSAATLAAVAVTALKLLQVGIKNAFPSHFPPNSPFASFPPVDKDGDRQVAEAGVVGGSIQEPEGGAEEVSVGQASALRHHSCALRSFSTAVLLLCLQLRPSLCSLPGDVPDGPGLHRGGNTQLH